jgi:hypothetical protein
MIRLCLVVCTLPLLGPWILFYIQLVIYRNQGVRPAIVLFGIVKKRDENFMFFWTWGMRFWHRGN